jgi:hypothetical protein
MSYMEKVLSVSVVSLRLADLLLPLCFGQKAYLKLISAFSQIRVLAGRSIFDNFIEDKNSAYKVTMLRPISSLLTEYVM